MDEESLSLSEISDRISQYMDQSLDSNDVELLKPPDPLVHKSEQVVMMEEDARTGFEPEKFLKEDKLKFKSAGKQYMPIEEASNEEQGKNNISDKVIDFDSEKIQFKKGVLIEDRSKKQSCKEQIDECLQGKNMIMKNSTEKIDCSLGVGSIETDSSDKTATFDIKFHSNSLIKQSPSEEKSMAKSSSLEISAASDSKPEEMFSENDTKLSTESEVKQEDNKCKPDHEFKDIGSEEARMGFENDKNTIDSDTVSNVLIKGSKGKIGEVDEDSVSSMTSQRSNKRKLIEEDSNLTVTTTNADTLFEYQWPSDQGDYFMIQEQVSEFLGIKSFKRKYPDLLRRSVEIDEREHIRERMSVSEMQCDLGLTAVRSEDVIELMAKDYPEKYQEYERVFQERESKIKLASRKVPAPPSVFDKTKLSELVKRAVQATAEYNARFNQERREGRKACFDLQTQTIHYPIGKMKRKYKNISTNHGTYPFALIPGQFNEYYRSYTPMELKYLPLNTVVYGPPPTINGNHVSDTHSDDSMSDSDDSSSSGDSSSSQESHDGSGDSIRSSGSNKKSNGEKGNNSQAPPEGTFECRVCHKWEEDEQVLVQCSDCKNRGHPSCLQLTDNMVQIIKTYKWQCMDCKSCVHCENPYDEDKMMFCDKCDRGYHTFCVGVRTIPSGRWICKSCGQCAMCGSVSPGPEGSTRSQWQNEYAKNKNGDMELVRTLCITCSKLSDNRTAKTGTSASKGVSHKAGAAQGPTPVKRGRGRPRKFFPEKNIVVQKVAEVSEEKEESACSEDTAKEPSETEPPLPPRRFSRRAVATEEEK